MNYKFLLCVLTIGILFTLNAQTEVQITATKDNTLYEDTNGSLSNGAGDHIFVGNTNNGDIRRAVLQFDLSNDIPSDATIESATLTLNMSKTATGSQPVNLHLLESDWGEGTSHASREEGAGAASTTDDATWIHTFYDTQTWNTAGGDFVSSASASLSVGNNGQYTFGSTTEMVSDVQGWVDDPSSNFGWILVGDETQNQTAKRFDSKDNTNADNRPILTVSYTPPTSIEADRAKVPETVSLAQNYPNPFNPSTFINYSLTADRAPANVSVEVYNQLGQKIATLVEQNQQAGTYTVEWNGRSEEGRAVPSGVYIYRLTVGNKVVDSKKMTLLK